ncbi:MAG: hypothetical protein ACI8PT_004568 [Gammaproteobacteria bacterium]|jgi:hypothetical protein
MNPLFQAQLRLPREVSSLGCEAYVKIWVYLSKSCLVTVNTRSQRVPSIRLGLNADPSALTAAVTYDTKEAKAPASAHVRGKIEADRA